jgi:hypothetical protein
MNCYAVFLKSTNEQLRVFQYSIIEKADYIRAGKLAFNLAHDMHRAGYPCTIERFHICDVGVQVEDTDVSFTSVKTENLTG